MTTDAAIAIAAAPTIRVVDTRFPAATAGVAASLIRVPPIADLVSVLGNYRSGLRCPSTLLCVHRGTRFKVIATRCEIGLSAIVGVYGPDVPVVLERYLG